MFGSHNRARELKFILCFVYGAHTQTSFGGTSLCSVLFACVVFSACTPHPSCVPPLFVFTHGDFTPFLTRFLHRAARGVRSSRNKHLCQWLRNGSRCRKFFLRYELSECTFLSRSAGHLCVNSSWLYSIALVSSVVSQDITFYQFHSTAVLGAYYTCISLPFTGGVNIHGVEPFRRTRKQGNTKSIFIIYIYIVCIVYGYIQALPAFQS